MADSIPQIVWASRPDGCLDFYNRKWYELTGADPNATGDQSWLPILHPDDRQKCLDIWYDSVRTGKPYYIEYRFKFPGSGEYRWHIGRALPAKDEQGNIIRWYGTSTDIHDFKVAQDKLTDLKTAFENRSKELETIMGIVSHDLRAPLVNVRGFAKEINKDISMLQKTLEQEPSSQETLKKIAPLFENFRQATHFISSSAESMDNLAVLLVNITRAGLAETKPKKLDMNEIINKIVASIKFKLKQTEVAYDICGALPSCFGDKQQVTQIFTNLLDNAVKYLDPGRPGKICVDGKIENNSALYLVADNGIGIAKEEQKKIFDPYYQLHEKAAGGVGMGLATVKRMIDRNDGKIWVDSEKGKGSDFYVVLPLPPD